MAEVCKDDASVWKKNIPLAILGALCEDAHNGVKNHPVLYLARYKNSVRRFSSYIFLGSFLPALLLILKSNPKNVLIVIVLQACCLAFVFILYQVLRYMFEAFEAVFYKNWFNAILNFDALAIRELRPQVLDSLAAVFEQDIWRKLNEGIAALAGQLEKFHQFREQGKELSGEDIIEMAQSKMAMLEKLEAAQEEIHDKVGAAFKDLSSVTRRNKAEINAITENTARLIELKDLMLNWRNNSQDAELDALRKVTERLEHNITKSFSNMEQTVELNAKELGASFERFSEVCHTLATLPAPMGERELITALQNLNEFLTVSAKQIGSEANNEV
jgi:hypothetical protein